MSDEDTPNDTDKDEDENVIPFAKARDPKPRPNGHAKRILEEKYATACVLFDPLLIKRRSWVYKYHYILGTVSSTVAPGGYGKTTLALFEALTMALMGYRVLYISAEDDMMEIQRRIAAHLQQHNIPREKLLGLLFVDDKMSYSLKIARMERFNTAAFNDDELERFEKAIAHDKIQIVTLDPLVSFHSVSENDTSAMDGIIKRLGEIAVRQQCSIELCHHVRKPQAGNFEITVHDARGAGAIVNAVRSCRVLNQMSRAAADKVGISDDERKSYLRIDNGKANMAPASAAEWKKLTSVVIGNGDNVQALVDFDYKVPRADAREDLLWLRNIFASGKAFRASSKANDWFGHEVAKHYGKDVKADHAWISDTIKYWFDKGFIKEVEVKDEQRRPRPSWALGNIIIDDEDLPF